MTVVDWSFGKAGLAESFDEYVREQLPWYDLASGMVAHVGRHYIGQGGLVYDLGAATGNIGRVLSETLTQRNARLIGIEQSAAFVGNYTGPGVIELGLIEDYEYQPFDFAVCFLTLMFVAPAERQALLERLRTACKPGGAVMLVEKQDPPGGYAGTVIRRMTLAAKLAAGVSPAEIIEKEVSLFGIQRPLSADFVWGAELFRFGEFAGWLWESPLSILTESAK